MHCQARFTVQSFQDCCKTELILYHPLCAVFKKGRVLIEGALQHRRLLFGDSHCHHMHILQQICKPCAGMQVRHKVLGVSNLRNFESESILLIYTCSCKVTPCKVR